ncbi:hypothetical protein K2173_011235 [Erythroxylum novogranatense]|uniref:NusB/RsmB/TIM44 domain-containing protein n=1 Tax=Erythroxylum novogranatense TaxID=1862640 RepID=A0AAV8TT50_9ROSI|nr:hypothetical protein K2173_011235 [Erythroxylum novogranatense]
MEGMCFSLSLPSCSVPSSSFSLSNHHHHHSRSNCLQFLVTFSTSSLVSVWPNYHSRTFLPLPTSAAPASASVLHFSAKDKKEANDEEEGATVMPKLDKTGRFCNPRAARELSLLIVYAACLEGSDPVRLFEKRMNARREPGYEFDKASLLEYNHMSFGGPPVTTQTIEEANDLVRTDEQESAIEAEVLSAPPKLVYSKLLLRFTRKLLVATVDKWDSHVLVIDKVVPPEWKNEPTGRILELCILHLAMSEIAVLGTRHQIVINEAVDLAKRFCDGSAPRIINGCLRTFVKDKMSVGMAHARVDL